MRHHDPDDVLADRDPTPPYEPRGEYLIQIRFDDQWTTLSVAFPSRTAAEWRIAQWKQENQCYGDPFRTLTETELVATGETRAEQPPIDAEFEVIPDSADPHEDLDDDFELDPDQCAECDQPAVGYDEGTPFCAAHYAARPRA